MLVGSGVDETSLNPGLLKGWRPLRALGTGGACDCWILGVVLSANSRRCRGGDLCTEVVGGVWLVGVAPFCGVGCGSWLRTMGGSGSLTVDWGVGVGLLVMPSFSMWLPGIVLWPGTESIGDRLMTGTYFLRNFLFLSVIRPEPSTLTTYWSN